MRLGLNWVPVRDQRQLEAALPLIDQLGLGAIAAPREMAGWSLDDCTVYGEMVRGYGLVIGEVGSWQNLLMDDEALRDQRIAEVRSLLQKADAMQVGCVVTLIGSFDDRAVAPHADNWSDRAQERAVENCHRILNGLELTHIRYALEPWCTGFYHEPDAVAEFLDRVDHPRLAVHMDVMNMHTLATYYQSTHVIERAFELLANRTASVHAKDLLWDPTHMFFRVDEVMPGDGVLDFDLYLRKLNELSPDMPVFTEHWPRNEQYVEAIQRLQGLAKAAGVEFVTR